MIFLFLGGWFLSGVLAAVIWISIFRELSLGSLLLSIGGGPVALIAFIFCVLDDQKWVIFKCKDKV